MDINTYVQDCFDMAYEYIEDIHDGNIKSCENIKLAIKRHYEDLENKKFIFKEEEVEKVFKFFYFLNVNYNNGYQQFQLLPYQAFAVLSIFGFYNYDGKKNDRRRYKYSFLFMAKKNGKTTFAAILQLYFLMKDGVQDPQSFLVASTREQAHNALEYAKGIIYKSPVLDQRLEPQRNSIVFKDKKMLGFSKTVAALNAERLDGGHISAAVMDEVHAYRDDALFRVIKSSTMGRKNSHIILISTAGVNKKDNLCGDLVELGKNILRKKLHDDSFFFMLFTLDEGDDYHDTSCWYKANPGLGTIIDFENMKIEYNQAINLPSSRFGFLTKNLNIFEDQETAWMEDNIVLQNLNKFDWDKYKGYDVVLGVDLSSTRDLSAVSLVLYDDEEEKYKSHTIFFMANDASKMFRKGGIDLEEWIKKKHIIKCQTATIDYDIVYTEVEKILENFNIIQVMYDKFNSTTIIPRLQQLGLYTVVFEQNTLRFNRPLKLMENLLFENKLDLGDNPVLRWNFSNVNLYVDGNGNIKIMKNKSGDSVDGCVSLAMALGGHYEYHNPILKLPSAYE